MQRIDTSAPVGSTPGAPPRASGPDVGFADEVHLRQRTEAPGGVEPLVALLLVASTATSLLTAWPSLLRGLQPDLLAGTGFSAFLALMVAFPVGAAVLLVPRVRTASGTRGGYLLLAAAGLAMGLAPFDGTAGLVWLVLLRVLQGAAAAMLLDTAGGRLSAAGGRLSAAGGRLGTGAGASRTAGSVAATVGILLGVLLGGALAVASWRAAVLVPAALALLGAALSSRPSRTDRRSEPTAAATSTPAPAASQAGSRSGLVAAFLAALARGGLPVVLVLWLQCLWLPLQDVDPDRTPLLAALCLVPLVVGFLIAAPVSAALAAADVRWPGPAGLAIAAASLLLLALLPANFALSSFVAILTLGGVGFGLAAAPVRAGARVGRAEHGRPLLAVQTAGTVASLVLLGALFVVGISTSLGDELRSRLGTAGVAPSSSGALSPTGALSATAAGAAPLADVADIGPARTPEQSAFLTDPGLLPGILAEPIDDGVGAALGTAAVACLLAAALSTVATRRRVAAAGGTTGEALSPSEPATSEPPASEPRTSEPPASEPPASATPESAPLTATTPASPASDPVSSAPAPPPAPAPSAKEHQVAGVVRLDGGAPVPATVTVTDLDGVELARSVTDEEGRFAVGVAEPGRHLLVLTGVRIVSTAVFVDVPGTAPLELTVRSATGVLRGRLQSPRGPVGDGIVVLTTDGRPLARTTTDRDGAFVLADVPAGVHVLTAAAPEGEPRAQLVRMPRSGEMRLDVNVETTDVPAGQQAGGTVPVSS